MRLLKVCALLSECAVLFNVLANYLADGKKKFASE